MFILQNLGPYVISKTALLALTKILAVELASSNIRVNCIAPGLIKTKFSQIVSRVNPVTRLNSHTVFDGINALCSLGQFDY